MLKTMYDNMDPETIKKQQDYMNNFSLNVNVNNAKGEELAHPDDPYDELTVNRLNEIRKLYPDVNTQDQKIGMTGIVDAIVAVNAVIDAVHNYDDVQELRDKYSDFMNKSETDYSKDDRLSIMNNKKRIAFLQNAIETGNQEAYDKYLKKVPEKDREAVKKLIEDINKTANKQKVSEENQEILDEHLGSISKPKIHKSYLNEDGTLNERGKTRTASNRKISDVASSVFLALRNINIFEAAATGIGGLILSFSGFGIPLALATTLASGIMAGAAGVDNALYKKLEKRADAYYEMLQ